MPTLISRHFRGAPWLTRGWLGRAAAAVAILGAAPAGAGEAEVRRGKLLFDRPWRAPAGQDPIGPLFNARSCGECHPGGGAGAPDGPALVLGTGGDHPVFGRQLQPQAVAGVTSKPAVTPAWETVALPGGTLRRPRWALGGAPLEARLASDLHGMGLLARIPEGALLAAADPEDGDGDGVSGRVRWLGTSGGRRPGRFGRKAEHATLAAQVVDSLAVDMGLASAVAPPRRATAPRPSVPASRWPAVAPRCPRRPLTGSSPTWPACGPDRRPCSAAARTRRSSPASGASRATAARSQSPRTPP